MLVYETLNTAYVLLDIKRLQSCFQYNLFPLYAITNPLCSCYFFGVIVSAINLLTVWYLLNIQKLSGGTTVSATMFLAYHAGINVFVTGGIGGVHHEGELSIYHLLIGTC